MKATQLFISDLKSKLLTLKDEGLFKSERIINSPQGGKITISQGEVINLCSNNYLGLANDQRLVKAAKTYLDSRGFGLSSVRFICGTQDIHKELEESISRFLGTEDTILYSSCFDANGGLFETLLDERDAIISDALNHASIIDGIRLSKAQRFRYENSNINDLEAKLREAQNARYKLIATDGVFSMDGTIAKLKEICALAEKYHALVMVDDSHAVGFMGDNGKGTHEYHECMDKIDIITGTLGKALGGASGGYTSGRKDIIAWLRQKSRPYLFSNTLAPVIAGVSIEVIKILEESGETRKKLWESTAYFRRGLKELGFNIIPGIHPICPIMFGDAELASRFAEELLAEGIYVIGFSYPVVPKGAARIRTQVSAGLELADIEKALKAFAKIGKKLSLI